MPLTPISCSASFTSSSLNGLMTASTFFTSVSSGQLLFLSGGGRGGKRSIHAHCPGHAAILHRRPAAEGISQGLALADDALAGAGRRAFVQAVASALAAAGAAAAGVGIGKGADLVARKAGDH